MVEWKAFQEKQRRHEFIYIIMVSVIEATGVLLEFISKTGHGIIIVDDLSNVSLVAVQIQATVYTLTFSLLALLGGRITDEFLGIKYNDYILNLKPQFLKQSCLASGGLIFVIVNVFCHIMAFYNLTIANFIIAVILIEFSVTDIYKAFIGTEIIEDEIKAYVISIINVQNNCKDYFDKFCIQWNKEITGQELGEYEVYSDIFDKYFAVLIQDDSTRQSLLDHCIDLARFLLRSSGNELRGILFVKECYRKSWLFIKSKKLDNMLVKQKKSFYLFDSVYREFTDALLRTKVKDVEKVIDLGYLIDLIVEVDSFLGYNYENKDRNTELYRVTDFGQFKGYYISPKYSSENAAERNNEYWGAHLSRSFSWLSLSEDSKNDCNRIIAAHNFKFMVSLLMNDTTEIIEEYVYNRAINSYHDISPEYAFMVLMFHCYIYYLSEFESLDCIDEELKDKSRKFLYKENNTRIFHRFLIELAERDKNIYSFGKNDIDIFNDHIINDIEGALRSYEHYPRAGGVKKLVMENSVEQFVLFASLFLTNYFHRSELLDRVITEEMATGYYINYIRDNDKRDQLKNFFKILGINQDIDQKTDSSYSVLENAIKGKYKLWIMKKASETEKIIDYNIEDQKKLLAQNVKNYLVDQFYGIMGEAEGKEWKCNLLNINGFVDQELIKMMNGNYDYLFWNFMHIIVRRLKIDGKLKVVPRKSFKTDDELLNYIRHQRDCVFVGSEFILRPEDFNRSQEFKDAIYEAEHYTNGANGPMIIIDKNALTISIEKVRVGVHIPTIAEAEAGYSDEKGLYTYEASLGMLVYFTEDELSNYLDNTRRTIDVVIHIKMDTAEEVIGDLIE